MYVLHFYIIFCTSSKINVNSSVSYSGQALCLVSDRKVLIHPLSFVNHCDMIAMRYMSRLDKVQGEGDS